MITVNSLSGGKTSSYLAANYPADYNVFALVRTSDKNCMFPDEKVRQIVSDRLGIEFIGTLEEDMIIYTMLDLEQYIGREIKWVTGRTFDEIIRRGAKKYLPNVTQRFCTEQLKIEPMFRWWQKTFSEPVEMRIGYRANEVIRKYKMLDNLSANGYSTFKGIVGKSKSGKRNRWGDIEWQKPSFPLIDDGIFKDNIEDYWTNKPVRFAELNNCVGCFHRNEMLLKLCSIKQPSKFQWFIEQEKIGCRTRTFKNGITYQQIKDHPLQIAFDYDDFDECDSGYCGL